MLLSEIACPVCGALPRGTLEICVAEFASGPELEWNGSIDTDNSTTLFEQGQPVLCCENGHAYQHARFTAEVLTNLG